MSRKKRKSNYQKLKEAPVRVNQLEATILAFCTGELPRTCTLQQILFKQYGEKLAQYEFQENETLRNDLGDY